MITIIAKQFGELTVEAHVINDHIGLRVKLRCGDIESRGSGSYESVETIKVGNRVFAYAFQYWEGTLPTEEPFEIVKGQ